MAGWQKLEHKTLQLLLTCAWLGNPHYFAETAADHFIDCKLAFIISYDSGIGEPNNNGGALPLLKAISPIVRPETYMKLETAIHGYITPAEMRERRYRGQYELILWQQLQWERISKKGKARVAELKTKFPEQKLTRAEMRRQAQWRKGGFVPSPIPQIGFAKMTDAQLIEALRRYSSPNGKTRERKLVGRAEELHSSLMHAAKTNRKRFAALVLKLPDDVLPLYFDGILWGLVDDSRAVKKSGPEGQTETEAPNDPLLPTDIVLQVIQRVHQLPNRPCGRAICRVADSMATEGIPAELIRIVAHYAINDSDSAVEEQNETAKAGTSIMDDPLTIGINSVRGSAADSFSRFLFAHSEMAERLLPFVEALANDKSIGVRAVNVQALTALLNTHRDKAVSLFLKTCEIGERLWTSDVMESFLYYATFSHYPILRPLLRQMLASGEKEARHRAARQVTVAAFRHADAEDDMKAVLTGGEECRCAAAEIYAHNVHYESARDKCIANLITLFNDPVKLVRETAARWFHARNGVWTEWQRTLLRHYVASAAYADGEVECQMNLEATPERLPEEVLLLAEKALELYEQEMKKSSPDPLMFSHYMPRLTLRYYEQSKDEATRRRCLDFLDRMIAFGWGEASVELGKSDRW